MGRIGISYKEVVNAIHTLHGQNKNPTVDNIRSVLKTGSKSTIARYLKEWRQSENITSPYSDANKLPEEILSLVKGLWQQLQEKADSQIENIQQDYIEKEKNLNEQLTKLLNENKQQQIQIHSLEENIHTQQKNKEQLELTIQQNQNEQIKLSERYEALKTRLNESKNAKDKLHEHFKQVQTNLEHYQQSEQKLKEKQAIELDSLKNQYQTKINNLENELFSEASDKQKRSLELNNLEQNFKSSQQEIKDYKEQTKTLKSVSIKYEALQNNHDNINKQLIKSHGTIESYKQNNHKLEILNEQILGQNQMLESKLSKAEDKINTLREEKSFISHEKANLAGQLSQMQAVMANS